MIRLFTRRRGASHSPEAGAGSAQPRTADREGQRMQRRAQPGCEALDSRVLMTSSGVSATPATTSSDLSNRVAQALQPYLASDAFPGISVAVVSDGQVALAEGYGVGDARTRWPVTANTRFDIGSVTKTFTAIGILQLYQESQGTARPLDLDAPISDYLHNTKSFKLPAKWSGITTRELLDMSSGLRNVGTAQPWSVQLNSIAKYPLLYTPGTESYYSNANYYLLGEMIQQWTGENYGAFIQSHILSPLGMSSTEELGGSATVKSQAVGYDTARHGTWPKAAMQNGPALYAAAGMISTANDMATYMKALLDGALLDPATYSLMWTSTPTPQYPANSLSNAERGLGWDTAIDAGATPVEVTKGGQVPGFSTELILFPSTDSGVYVSFNSQSSKGVSALQVAETVEEAVQP